MTLIFLHDCNTSFFSYTYYLFSFHAGSLGIQSVPLENLPHDSSTMQDTSQLSTSHDYHGDDEPMHDVPATSAPAIPGESRDTPKDIMIDAGNPEGIQLEVHIPLPSAPIVADLRTHGSHSELPVSHSSLDI